MHESGVTFKYPPCLGTAVWEYVTDNKVASTNFKVCSIALNENDPLNLSCSHDFFSKTLSPAENAKGLLFLTKFLNSINAINITTRVRADFLITQSIFVNYEIQNVEQDKVDALTTTIASVCKKTIEDISIYNNCSSSNFLN